MQSKQTGLAAIRAAAMTCLALALPVAALAQDDSSEALAVVDAAFDAIRAKDQAAMLSLFLPDGTSTRLRDARELPADASPLRRTTNAALISQAFNTDSDIEERWTGTPTVRVDGDLALVWGRYEFLVDGSIAHCGVNHVDLVRLDGRWRITNWTWSVQTENCIRVPAAPDFA